MKKRVNREQKIFLNCDKIDEYFINSESYNYLLKALSMGMDFKIKNRNKVVNYRDAEELKDSILEPMPLRSKNLKEVLNECKKKIIKNSVNFSSPHFLAFPDCGNSVAGMCGHIISGMLNQNLINSMHCSPSATFVEMTTINWLREIIGYSVIKDPQGILDVGGINVPGGTLANTVALLLARENKFPGTMSAGLNNKKPLKMFIPAGIGHFTSKAAISWLGIGSDNIVEVKTTKNFTIDREDLIKKIEESSKEGGVPFVMIAYAGDSRTMAIDDFKALSKIAKKYGLWFHVDACHGASLCFSDKLKNKVAGIDLADSITLDPHKVLFVNYPLSYVLVKDPLKFTTIAGVSDLITKEKYSFGQITPFLGSRPFNSLKLWFLIKNLGKKKIGKLIEKRHNLVKYFAFLIKKTSDFYLMNEVIINSAAYIYVPKKLKIELHGTNSHSTINKINELNLKIQKRMFMEGDFYVHTFQLNDFKNVLGAGEDKVYQMQRLMLGNPQTTKKDILDFINYSKKISEEEWKKMSKDN